ncbi:MAG TPA: hypothetical protein VNT99_09905 [Methylomirabilota bacterium]|nr:hypothetical protein [Methylomirabilota bacterium]
MSARFLAFVGLALAALCGIAQQSPQQTNVMSFQDLEQSGTGLG